jgi:hypothetical protein
MRDHYLLTTQKNAVLAVIRTHGLDPREFEWSTTTTRVNDYGPGWVPLSVPHLTHAPSGSTFTFDFSEDRRVPVAIYSPADETPEEVYGVGTWTEMLMRVDMWVSNLKRQYTTPDLWAELERERELFAGRYEAVENTPFSTAEQLQIARQLDEVKAYLRQTYELTADQQRAIEVRLDYLVDAASRMHRLDWRNAFVGAFVGVLLEAALPERPVRDVLNVALRGLGHLFGVELPELPAA